MQWAELSQLICKDLTRRYCVNFAKPIKTLQRLESFKRPMPKEHFLGFLEAINCESALHEKLSYAVKADAVAAFELSAGFETVSQKLILDFLGVDSAQKTAKEQKVVQEDFSV